MEEFQAHSPSRWSVVVVFAVIVALIGGIFFWAFYLNVGTVRVSSSEPFRLSIDSDLMNCDRVCEEELPAGRHQFVASREGYYDQVFVKNVEMGDLLEEVIVFQLIPYLSSDDPDPSDLQASETYRIPLGSNGRDLVDGASGTVVTSFESLQSPVLHGDGQLVSVVDDGRLFLVDVDEKSKRRLFDDSVQVVSAQVSDADERVLLHVQKDEEDQMWIWRPESAELVPMDIYEASDEVVWYPGEDHRLLMIVEDVELYEPSGLLDDLVSSVTEAEMVPGLIAYNLDTREGVVINEFPLGAPERIFRVQNRVFLAYTSGDYQEVVVQE